MPTMPILFRTAVNDTLAGAGTKFHALSFFRFAVNTIDNTGTGSRGIKGYNIQVQYMAEQQGDISEMNKKVVAAASGSTFGQPTIVDEDGTDRWEFIRGAGTDQVSEHYKKYFVQRKTIKMSIQQYPTTMNAAEGHAGGHYPGFTMFSRLLNQTEEDLADAAEEALQIDLGRTPVRQNPFARAKHYDALTENASKFRKLHWTSNFRTLSANPDVEMDELTGEVSGAGATVSYPVTHTDPPTLVYGEIGFIPDLIDPMAGNEDGSSTDMLKFKILIKVIYDIIYFDDDIFHIPAQTLLD